MAGREYRVGVLGATGAVGTTILEVLVGRGFPASEIVPFASERSAGKAIEIGEELLECRLPSPESIEGIDILISSAGRFGQRRVGAEVRRGRSRWWSTTPATGG